MRFIDLFAGLGGFHLALSRLGHTCVFACEINPDLNELYQENFGISVATDLREVKIKRIPSHDILCAGFPCQPFSKAGEQQGFDCPRWGDLFMLVSDIIEQHEPQYLLLENVPNLKRHNNGKTWGVMLERLKSLGYEVDADIISPHHFGIPQIRERVFIVGAKKGLQSFKWPKKNRDAKLTLHGLLESNPAEARPLQRQAIQCLKVWNRFVKRFPKNEELPSFPIWSAEFGATYPFETTTPSSLSARSLCRYKGSHGIALTKYHVDNPLDGLPSYAKTNEEVFPKWKIDFIRQNRELYTKHKSWIDEWLPDLMQFPPSYQKFEWNCKGETRDVWRYIIQFRASGVRIKRPQTSPSLVAMTTSQVPIIGWERRYMTPKECARIQNLDDLRNLPKTQSGAFKALGNAVNSKLVEIVAKNLVGAAEPPEKKIVKCQNPNFEVEVSLICSQK